MLDKRDIDTTLIDILDDLKYVAVDFRENFSAMKDSLGVAARSIYHSVKFLFDGTTAAGRRAEEMYGFKGTDEEQLRQAQKFQQFIRVVK